ncbi:MAG: hypothetical protein CL878_05535, partial [Dehalococcoidia bacterium]|nr:hypothetical protein [Dehalococcoidia bacterium]
AGGYAAYRRFLLPRLGRLGATIEEATRRLPGDDLLPGAAGVATRAITIRAPAPAVWPWLVQMGHGRASWYTYEWFEKSLPFLTRIGLVSREYYERWCANWVPNADQLIPGLQELQVGDVVLDGPPGTAYFKVEGVTDERALVLYSVRHPFHGRWPDLADLEAGLHYEFSWAFVLHPVDAATCRLIIRMRFGYSHQWWLPIATEILLAPVDTLMQWGMLAGIRRRAEEAWS